MSEKIEKFFGIVALLYLIFATLVYIVIAFLSDVSIYHAMVVGVAAVLVTIVGIMGRWLK